MGKCHQSRLFYFFNFISLTKCNIWLILNIFTCVCHLIIFHPKHSLSSLLYFVCFCFANAERIEARMSLDRQVLCYSVAITVLLHCGWGCPLAGSCSATMLCLVPVVVVPVVVVVVAQDAPWLAVPLLLCYIHGPIVVLLLIPVIMVVWMND